MRAAAAAAAVSGVSKMLISDFKLTAKEVKCVIAPNVRNALIYALNAVARKLLEANAESFVMGI